MRVYGPGLTTAFAKSFSRGAVLCALILCGCHGDPAAPPPGTSGLWARYTPFRWTHDGSPYRSAFFTVYSDAAPDAVKRQVGEIADTCWAQILKLFDVDDSTTFRYPPGASRLEIYINRNHEEGINWAYWGGFIITIRAAEITGHRHDYVVYTVAHELTHDLEFLIEGREDLGTDVWFKEGIATFIGCLESTAFRTIRSLSELDSWIAQNRDVPGGGNPIAIHQDSDYPPEADRNQYYRLFELALRYLLDEQGAGRSVQDVRDVFVDLSDGIPFPVSFRERFGMDVDDFEAGFFDHVRSYLSPVAALTLATGRVETGRP
ncbi:MAG: hypothetical protein P8099_15665 [Gemmatimonadota bacterium]|jgi:hypothetical protein